jgi:hypothetical protein
MLKKSHFVKRIVGHNIKIQTHCFHYRLFQMRIKISAKQSFNYLYLNEKTIFVSLSFGNINRLTERISQSIHM